MYYSNSSTEIKESYTFYNALNKNNNSKEQITKINLSDVIKIHNFISTLVNEEIYQEQHLFSLIKNLIRY